MQGKVNLSDKSPYVISAASSIENGYSYQLCFVCNIRTNVFRYKHLVITGKPNGEKERKVKYIKASIKSISSMGLMKIEFSELMNTNFTL